MEHKCTLETRDHSVENDNVEPAPKPSSGDDSNVRKERESATVNREAHTCKSRNGHSSRRVSKESDTVKKQNVPKAQALSKQTSKKWTFEHLLHNSNSELTKCTTLKKRIDFRLLNLLPQDDLNELCKLFPPADINFIKYHQTEDLATEVVAESMEEYEAMVAQPDKYFPTISSRFKSPEFIRTVEDFQILLSSGYYEIEARKEEEPKRTTGRKRNIAEAEDDSFKDENYEAYWGERMKMHQKKRGRK